MTISRYHRPETRTVSVPSTIKTAPVAVIMISLNEAHNMQAVLDNLKGWAQEVFLVDSFSADQTVDIALANGVHVVQRRFRGFGDQWNFALQNLPITAPWTMKLDPDERLTDKLKQSIKEAVESGSADGFSFDRRLWFMGQPLPIMQEVLRVWKTGCGNFTDVAVNEHPVVSGLKIKLDGVMEHHDSPHLHHWVEKQNKYSTMEAISFIRGDGFADVPNLLGTSLQRRMWFKKHFMKIPFRYVLSYLINLVHIKVWRSGIVGFSWARLRVWARRMREDKVKEMLISGRQIDLPRPMLGTPHPGAIQADCNERF